MSDFLKKEDEEYLTKIKGYSLNDLMDIKSQIDKENYPARYDAIVQEIKIRQDNNLVSPKTSANQTSTGMKVLGIFLYIFSGLSFLSLFAKRPSDSMNLFLMQRMTAAIYPFLLLFLGLGCFRKRSVETNGVEYVEAPRRAISMLIDSLIFTIPILLLQSIFLKGPFFLFFCYTISCGLFLQSLWIFFLTKYGATPGKMLLGIIVLKDTFEPIKFKEALLRSSVDLFWVLLTIFGSFFVLLNLPFNEYRILGFQQRNLYLFNRYPTWLILVTSLQQYWMWSEVVVMFFNKRRKAIHDYIAGTIVIRNNNIEFLYRNGSSSLAMADASRMHCKAPR